MPNIKKVFDFNFLKIVNRIFVIIIALLFLYFNVFFRDNLIWNIFLSLSKSIVLLFLFFFFNSNLIKSKSAQIFLFSGFFIWSILQFLGIFLRANENEFIADLFGFGFSLIAKILILIGIIIIAITVEKRKTVAIARANEAKKQLEESSKKFEDILKSTFHEITIPFKTLEEDISKLPNYINRDYRSVYKSFVINFERVKAILMVSKNSYRSEISHNLDDTPIDNNSINTDITSRSVSVNFLIEKAVISVKNSYNDVQIIQEYGSSVIVKCNQNEVLQVFTNLIKNSIESYLDEGPKKIIIRSFSQKKTNEESPKFIVVEIEDFGKGIPFDLQEKVWQKGFTTKETNNIMVVRGEGLFIVKNLADKNNIKIEIQSPVQSEFNNERHIGTKFSLYFKKHYD